ncbi:MAG: NAD(P)/FAD-dependent oxidoreductase [Acidimicrobiales bacterium]
MVVGGGPAGAAAAVTLARAGRRVVVVDRARFPRDKCCGDGLTAGALRELEGLGLSPASVPSWKTVNEVALRSPSARTVVLGLGPDSDGDGGQTNPGGRGGAWAAVARRRDLDAALLDLAAAAGAEVRDGHAFSGARHLDRNIELSVDGAGSARAPFVVGADGMWSPLRRALVGPDRSGSRLGDWHAFRQYYAGVGPQAARMWVWFEPDLLPGYAWSFPLPDGRANVGFGVRRDPGVATGELSARWTELLARPHLREVLGPDARPEAAHRAWPIPARLGRVPLTAAGGRALFAGDAAAATDPLTGEGIAQALLTGRLAAESILASRAPADVAASYERAVMSALGADDRLSRRLGDWLVHEWVARGAIRAVGASSWTRRQFGRWLFEDEPRAVVFTPRRWHGRMFRRDPPYQGWSPAGTPR